MAEFLFELLTEEIPARMQMRAAEDLLRLAREKLAVAGLEIGAARSFVTPRRLTLVIDDLPAAQPDTAEERRGPRVGAPENAVQGFLKSTGLTSLQDCEQRDTGKGIFYFATIRRAGRPTAELLPELLRSLLLEFPWPKSMRFPAAHFRWVRPLTSVLCLFGGKVIPLELDAIPVGDRTLGHRFLSSGSIAILNFADYVAELRKAHVILDGAERQTRIAADLAKVAASEGLAVKEDTGLLDEVTGLVEWPVVLTGGIDPQFMSLPPEVLTTSMRTHQKYFACLDAKGNLAPRFLVVANNMADDAGKAIVAGNERVLRARLSDARFFWDQDRKVPLAARLPKLADRVFHAKLGSVLEKTSRVMRLAEALMPFVPDADSANVLRAAELAKADLSSGMVGEFPELQGIMGRYYALNDGEAPEVAEAIADHYSPLGPNDRCPSAPVSITVALADKLDTLVGFFAIDEKPTGSKDPFALRRAALGVIRIIIENKLRLPLRQVLQDADRIRREAKTGVAGADPATDLLAFFADRLKVYLREKGVRHDLINAVFALGEDDFVRLIARVEALAAFLQTEDGANLLTAYRRAANILRIEEKKDGVSYTGNPVPERFVEAEEKTLSQRLDGAMGRSVDALDREAFGEAMAIFAGLRAPIDEFFTTVTVNSGEGELRANRLRLLARLRDVFDRVADFSQIEG